MHNRSLIGIVLAFAIGLTSVYTAHAQMLPYGNAYFVTGDTRITTRYDNRDFIIGKDNAYNFATIDAPITVTFEQTAVVTNYGSLFPGSPGVRYDGTYIYGNHRIVGKDIVNLERLTARDTSVISMYDRSFNNTAEMRENSMINFNNAATAGRINLHDKATLNFNSTSSGRFRAEDNSTVNIGSGYFSGSHFFIGSSTANITGGFFSYGFDGGSLSGVYAGGNSVTNISGGTFEGTVTGMGDSLINMRGGAYNGSYRIYLRQNTFMNFYGANMSFEQVSTWQYGKVYQVEGDWNDGTSNTFSLIIYDQDTYDGTAYPFNPERQFALVVVPEAGTLMLMAGALGFGAVGAGRQYRKRNAAPRL